METQFQKKLEILINEYSKENDSDTPDFILARYLNAVLDNFNAAVMDREQWYNRIKHVEDIKDIDDYNGTGKIKRENIVDYDGTGKPLINPNDYNDTGKPLINPNDYNGTGKSPPFYPSTTISDLDK